MAGKTVIIRGSEQRELLTSMVSTLDVGTVVRIMPLSRSLSQNDKMWALLTDISRAKPMGLDYSPVVWKALFMSAFGIESKFIEGLCGEPVPVGYHTSSMSKPQMSEFLEFIQAWAAEHIEFQGGTKRWNRDQ